jgi:hypothetical protein
MDIKALLLLNSSSPAYRQGMEAVAPYLDHFGIPYTTWDLNHAPLPVNLKDYALVVIAHPQVDPAGHPLNRPRLLEAVIAGTGLVSFDPTIITPAEEQDILSWAGSSVTFVGTHPITARHTPGEAIQLGREIPRSHGRPFLAVTRLEAGRIVQWASSAWMDTQILGPLSGLDDVLWRSLAWAARKPFVLRGLPPIVTMRVDDVAGTGHLWGQSPLWWVHTANRYGFKPWLGLFIYNLTEPAISELRDLLLQGNATAFPHAFGRPNRLTPDPQSPTPYYFPAHLQLRASSYDEFIYFDHENGRPWDDIEAARSLATVDDWYAAHQPLPMSCYAIAHWGEMGVNTISHVRERWGCDFFANYHGLNAPLEGAHWLTSGPFRQYEKPGSALFDRSDRGGRPVYYADFINLAGQEFFLCLTEIRDETGYEWAPDGDVAASVGRGLRQLRRAFDGFALPVLFTHETDYVYKISPADWEAQIALIASGITDYQPIFVTLDEGVRRVRATKTSRLESASFDPATGQVTVHFGGRADAPTGFYLFRDEQLASNFVEIPPFDKEWTQTI